MNVLDLHLIQNYPVSCLVRDENGSPKSTIFGGTIRAKGTSQSYKRAVREMMKSFDKVHFGGIRTRSIASSFNSAFLKKGLSQELSTNLSNAIADFLGTSENDHTKTVLYFSEGEIKDMAEDIVKKNKAGDLGKVFDIKKEGGKTIYKCKKGQLIKATPIDIADIEIFGRMMASDPNLFVEGAASFAHMFSVHECENEIDFFSAVDETSSSKESGAGHVGDIEYNSACYYNCVSLNLDLFNNSRLSNLPKEVRKDILKMFIEACILAVPRARHNSMFAATKPSTVLGLVRENTFELSLANAYEKPIRPSREGYTSEARKRLKEEWDSMVKAYGKRLGVKKIMWFPDVNLDTFIEGLV